MIQADNIIQIYVYIYFLPAYCYGCELPVALTHGGHNGGSLGTYCHSVAYVFHVTAWNK